MMAEVTWQSYLAVFALVIILFLLVRSMRKRVRPPAGGPVHLHYRSTGAPEEKRLRRSMEELLVELQEVSRDINAQLDTKMRALNQLTDRAEEAIHRLEGLLQPPAGHQPTASSPQPPGAEVESKPPVDPRHARVHDLADEGLSAVEIARRTGQSVGEVELILSLRPAKGPRTDDDRGRSLDMRT